jgi:hypothetical protein
MSNYTFTRIDVERIRPEDKDFKRAETMSSFKKARAQANAIKDPMKLIRRLKAVLSNPTCEPEYAEAFKTRALEMGFSDDQMEMVNELTVLSEMINDSIGNKQLW